MLNAIWSRLAQFTLQDGTLFAIALTLFWFVPRFMDGFFAAFEAAGARLARKKLPAILAIAWAVIVLRLCALSWMPIPFPQAHDEFSYLLAGDTFAHGRLTNPTHPLWVFFDTIHVNQLPTYMSKYPPAQGAILALGEVLGHPWIGVLLSCAAMCAAFLWAFQGWLPPQWAFLGTVLLLFRISLFSYWINSYFGGAVAATGGALVIGAFPRIVRCWRTHDAFLLGLGVAILANSRPFEGFVFCIPIAFSLIFAIWRKRAELWQTVIPRFLAPLCIVGVTCGFFMIYYNVRGTGHPFLFPYTVNDQLYSTIPVFAWQKPREPFHHTSLQLDEFYNGWERESWFDGRVNNLPTLRKAIVFDIVTLTHFCLSRELCLVAPALLCLWGDKKFRFLLVQGVICVGAFVCVPWFWPHYAAPLVATIFLVISQSLRHLRRWSYQGRPVGVGLSRLIVLFVVFVTPARQLGVGLSRLVVLFVVLVTPARRQFHETTYEASPGAMHDRERFSRQLSTIPGNHLVIVRYSESHNIHSEWVYNEADIDHSKVVWAREIPGVDPGQLLAYFHERRVWLAEPDASPPRLTPFPQ
ncbi:MAG: hypothetical protein ABSA57_08085 [Candidatus Acidiferrales bacterium]|jgi:hypothetical protein